MFGYVLTWTGVGLLLLDSYAVIKAVLRKHGVQSTLAWIFAIIALPGFGALIYLALGGPTIKRATTRNRPTRRGRFASDYEGREPIQNAGARRVAELAAATTGLEPTLGNEVRMLAKAEDAFEAIEAGLRSAKKFIWAEYYIIKGDETGRRFLEVLSEKAADGVEVYLLYDAVGSLSIDPARLHALIEVGGHARSFLPVNPLRRRWSTHLRNHRKLIVVDGVLGFTGGMNVGDEYSGRALAAGKGHFRDTHMSLRGPALVDLGEIFREDWEFTAEERLPRFAQPPHVGTSVVQIIPSGPDQAHNAHGMVYFAGIAGAESAVDITSPYFIPDPPIIRAIVSAALRGVRVRILVPARNDVAIVGWAARSYYQELLVAGVRIFEYQPSMLHAKVMVVDRAWSILGSANVDIRSFRLNFELGAMVSDPGFAEVLLARFEEDLAQSIEVSHEILTDWGLGRRVRDSTARLFSPLL